MLMRTLAFLVTVTMAGLGCSSTGGDGPGDGGNPFGGHGGGSAGAGGSPGTLVITASVSRDLDVVFVIDNSSNMAKAQANLVANFPAFVETMQAFPGGMPNLHLAVVSSDMGAGTGTSGCAGNGNAGIFRWGAPTTTCAATTDGAKFLSNINGSANYTGDLSSVFSCLAALGEDGCGYEQTLLSVTHALGADNFDSDGTPQAPPENQGFLRDGADLAIIVLTNEDDCSTPQGAANDLFPRAGDGSSVSTALGPPIGYRCNAFGHLCGTPPAAPPIMSPLGTSDPGDETTVVKLENCVSAEDSGRLIPVAAFAQALKSLKPDPANQILVAAISGLYPDTSRNAPYSVTWKRAPAGQPGGPWPEMVHSCVSAGDQTDADPGVRIGEFVKQFGRSGVLQSICDSSFRPAMVRIGDEIGRLMGPPCVTGVFADRSPTQAGTQYDCTVTDQVGGRNGPIASCDENGGAHPCWHLDADSDCRVPAGSPAGTEALRLTVDRDGVPASDLVSTTIKCQLKGPLFP
jgi:hypothetical protein